MLVLKHVFFDAGNPSKSMIFSFRASTVRTFIALSLLASTLQGCGGEKIPPGQILLRNDIQDSKNNVVVVDKIVSSSGLTGLRYRLEPGETQLIPQKNIRSLRFTRKYDTFSRVYLVRCPESLREGVSMKLIDVHTGRLQGGCSLTRKGEKKRGTIFWE